MNEVTRNEPSTRRRSRVLCVDDEPRVLAALSDNLRRRFDVVTADGGEAGLRALSTSGPFEVIVSDFQMPRMDGAEFLGRARLMAPDVTRVLLTGHASLEGALNAVNQGYVFRFLLKPCSPPDLIRALESAVEQYGLVTGDRLLLERRVAEMSGHLLQAERLAMLGTLAGGVGHELNNMLAVFAATYEFVVERAHDGLPPEEEDLAAFQHVRDHLATHARYLLNLGRPGKDGAGESDLCDVVDAAMSMLRSAGVLRSAVVRVEHPVGSPILVRLDRTRIEQIVLNLVKNAIDAMTDLPGRRPTIIVEAVIEEEGRFARLRVEDNGSGIPADKLETIFAPYYTTKSRERGTGLGLFVVKQIVESCGGEVAVESHLGSGTVFTLRLPLGHAE